LKSFGCLNSVDYSWSDADPDKMMSLTKLTKPFYIGETKKITCDVSPYFFSQGIHWGINYKNETTNLIKGEYDLRAETETDAKVDFITFP
jgi:hypothetical protein